MRQLPYKVITFTANKIFPAFFVSCSIAASVAQAAPQGGNIVAGQGTIQNNGNLTNISQQTGSMVIDWASFNVQQTESVNFHQPSSSAAVLNQIYDQNPSQILGSINANGRVFLSNPNGIIFGKSSTVNVGALFATSLNISNEDFMNGNYQFSADGDPGVVINRGILRAASGGSISLLGGQVTNEGVIIADYGHINLAAGRQAVVDFDGDGLISFKVSNEILNNISEETSAVKNSGTLQANGGQVLLEAHVAQDIFSHAVNNEGMITAHSMSNVGGEVYLSGYGSDTINQGNIDAYGEAGDGGTVVLLGDNVELVGNDAAVSINASGDKNGGTVLIGGDYQGQGDLKTAENARVDKRTIIEANGADGDGGKVIVWSDDTTEFHGQINARSDGGEGDGGFAEVSGKQHLLVSGHADLRSVNGQAGTLLLDPGSVDIVDGANTAPPVAMDTFNDGWIIDQLGSSSVIIDTNNSTNAGTEDITVDAAADITWSSANTLTLQADNNITVNGTINATGAGDITLHADLDAMGDGTINVASTGSLATATGDISLIADEITLNASSTTTATAGTVNMTSSIASQEIRINSGGNTSRLDLSAAELATVTAQNLTLGNSSHTGVINVNESTSLSTIGTINLLNEGNITINNDLTNSATSGVININADAAANGGTGAITAGSGDTLTAATVNLTAASGIGTTGNNVLTVAPTVSFSNTASGDVFISNTGNTSVSGSNTARNASITSSGTLTQGGVIDVATLITSSVGNTTLNLANTLTAYNGSTTSGGNIIVTDSAGGLDITGISSAGNATITTTGNLTQTGIITAGTLTTTSNSGNTTLNSANVISNFNGTTNTSGDISITDSAGGLDITGISSAGNATVATTGNLTQSGTISASTLTTTSSNGNTTLNSANTITSYNGTTTGSDRNIAITDNAGGLAITGISATGDVSVTTTGNLTQSGAITADTLTTVSTTGSTTLNSANDIDAYNGTSTGGTNAIAITDSTGGLDIVALSSAGNANITTTGNLTQTGIINATTLTTVSNSGNTTLNLANTVTNYNGTTNTAGNISFTDSAGGLNISGINSVGTASITTTGALIQSAIINATTLTTVSNGGNTTLTAANTITDYNGTTNTSGNIIVSDSAGGLNITGISSAGDASVTTTGALTQSGIINADLLTTVSNAGSTTLNSANTINSYNGTSNTSGDVAITAANALDITGLNSAANASITTTGDLTQSGTINAGTLTTVSTTGSTSLNSANTIAAYNGTSTGAGNNVSINDSAGGLNITGINSSADASITTTGALTQSGIINADLLTTVSNSGSTTLNSANTVNTYNGTTNTSGDVAITNASALEITGINSAANASISTTGNLTQSGSINAASLITSSTNGNTTLTDSGNTITSYSGSTTGSGDISVVDSTGGMTVTSVNAVGDFTANVGANLLTVSGALNAGDDITLIADKMAINAALSAGLGGSDVILRSSTAGNAIDLGSATDLATNTLELSAAELNNITANSLTIGDAAAGSIVISDSLFAASPVSSILLQTAGSIDDGASGAIQGGKNVAIIADTSILLDNAGHDIVISSMTSSGNITYVDSVGTFEIGSVTVDGTAYTGASGADISLTSTSGDLLVTDDIVATGSVDILASANDANFSLQSGNSITGTSASHTYTADQMDIAGTIAAAGQRVTLQTSTAGRDIILGPVGTSPGALVLSAAEITNVTADTLVIGRNTVDDIFVTQNVTPSNVNNLHLITGDLIDADNGADILGNKNLAITAGGNVIVTNGNTDVNTLAINAAGNDVQFTDVNDVIVGDVDGVSGIQANELTLVATDQINVSDGAAANDIDVTSTAVLATTSAASTIIGDGTIVAPELALSVGASGSATLTSTASDVDVLVTSGSTNGAITFTDVDDLTIGVVIAPHTGATLTGISANVLDLTVNGLLTVDAASGIGSLGATGDFTIRADKMDVAGTINASNTGRITLETATSGNSIDLGSATDLAANTIELSDAELNRITANTLVVGNTITTTGINISSDVTPTSISNLHLKAAGDVVATTGSLLGDRFLAITNSGNVTFDSGATDVDELAINSSGDVLFIDGDDFEIGVIDGVTGVNATNIDLRSLTDFIFNRSNITAGGAGNINIFADFAYASDAASGSGDLSSVSGDITITTDEIYLLAGNISSTGNLIIQQANDVQAIGLGDGSNGTLNLESSELALLSDGFNSITFGKSTAGNVDVNNVAFTDNVIINGADITLDSLDVAGNTLTLNASGSIRQDTGTAGIIADIVNLNASNQLASADAIGTSTDQIVLTVASQVNASAPNGGAIHLNSAGDIMLGAISALGTTGSVSLVSGGEIIDANSTNENITTRTLTMQAVDGIGSSDSIEVDTTFISLTNTGTGNIDVLEANNTTLLSSTNSDGDLTVVATNNLGIASGASISTTTSGTISLLAGDAINAAGTVTIDSMNGFVYNQTLNAAGDINVTTVDQLNITENMTSTAGDINLDTAAISFGPGVVFDATGAINILNAAVTANGDLTFNANGIDLFNTFTSNNGNLVLNSGTDDLSIANVLTVNDGNLNIIGSDLEIAPTGSIVATDTVTITDNGNGMELGGTPDPAKMNISLNEYDLITAGQLVLETQNTLTLNETFVSNTSTSPLTINANQMDVVQAGTTFGVSSALDLADTAVVAAADFTMNVGGAFTMNNSITTNGEFALTAGQGITMNEPTSITSNNSNITMTATGGDVLLGLVDAGTGNATINSQAGSILNNNGVFTDVTLSKTNIQATNVNLNANQRIGASSTDAITINASPAGLITLDFDADKAFINNLQNTRIQNNGTGDVAVGLIFSGQIIGIGHSVGVHSPDTEEVPANRENEDSMMSVLGTDYKLSAVDEEEEDSSTVNTVVPVMIRTTDGWEFKAPLQNPQQQKSGDRKVDWL